MTHPFIPHNRKKSNDLELLLIHIHQYVTVIHALSSGGPSTVSCQC